MKAVRQSAPHRAAPAHRHTLGPEHDHEPQHGLPELLPADETLLWQGAPDWRALAMRVFHLRKIALYFAALMALRGVLHAADGAAPGAALQAALAPLPLALAGLALLAVLAWLSARATVYTLTDRRVVMRIGIVLTVTYNLPFKRIAAAALQRSHDGHGDIALTLSGRDRIAWLQLWPHVRPWHLRQPEPTLRAVADAERVAALLSQAWSAAQGQAVATTVATPDRATHAPAAASDARASERGGAPVWQPQ